MSKCQEHNTPSPCLPCEMGKQTRAICGKIVWASVFQVISACLIVAAVLYDSL